MGNHGSQELLNNRQGEKPNGLYKRSFHIWKKEGRISCYKNGRPEKAKAEQ